jgi:hypothetical protein
MRSHDAEGGFMKLGNLSVLGVALATAFAATACNRSDDTASTYGNEPATSTAKPATETTPPPATTAGTETAATDTTTATEAAPAAAPTTTLADAATSFDDMDINKDGSLSQDELTDSHPLRQAFTVVDSDGNGMLSRSEVDGYRSRMSPPGG